jgi:hypothetical protein
MEANRHVLQTLHPTNPKDLAHHHTTHHQQLRHSFSISHSPKTLDPSNPKKLPIIIQPIISNPLGSFEIISLLHPSFKTLPVRVWVFWLLQHQTKANKIEAKV